MSSYTKHNIYKEALDAVRVGACNSSALVTSLASWLPQLWDDAGVAGTPAVNAHPVMVLIVAQLAFLAGLTLGFDTSEAEAEAEGLAMEYEAEEYAKAFA